MTTAHSWPCRGSAQSLFKQGVPVIEPVTILDKSQHKRWH